MSQPQYETLLYDVEDGIATITRTRTGTAVQTTSSKVWCERREGTGLRFSENRQHVYTSRARTKMTIAFQRIIGYHM